MSVHLEKLMGPVTRSAEELERLRRLEFEIPPRYADGRPNRLLRCGPDSWHWMRRGSDDETFRYVRVSSGWHRPDDPRAQLDAETRKHALCDFARFEGERFVGGICHALETFRSVRDRLSLPPSSDYRLSETDACYLLRACAVTAHDCCARTATKVVADIGGELFTIVELARPTIADALFETVRAARRLAAGAAAPSAASAAPLSDRARPPSAVPPPDPSAPPSPAPLFRLDGDGTVHSGEDDDLGRLRPTTPQLAQRPPPSAGLSVSPFLALRVDPAVHERCAAAVENLLYCLLTLDDVLQLGPPETPAEAIENTERLSLGRDYQRAMAAQRADAQATARPHTPVLSTNLRETAALFDADAREAYVNKVETDWWLEARDEQSTASGMNSTLPDESSVVSKETLRDLVQAATGDVVEAVAAAPAPAEDAAPGAAAGGLIPMQ
ncbi:hypothetical protein SO694_0005916 [Aureococcus anophagefferens]|uniref:Uncharacterized protein n=1 Tax=Aureococcus anophagefferens TaxID=44056 RepID=A0ABR1FYN1_AURAN